MSRSIWAAAGASVFALALTPGAALAADGDSSAARPASSHAKQVVHSGRRPRASRRLRHSGHRGTQGHVAVLLVPGSGYQQPAGSGPVRAVQRPLAGLGFAPGPIDGRYGPLTEQAVRRFQGAYGLTVDGIVGVHTLAALSATTSTGLLPGAGYQQAGGSGRVRALQRRLAGLGFAPGPIDGRYGPLTEQAVGRFQAAHGLQIDGIAGPQTVAQLRPQGIIPRREQAASHPRSNTPSRSPARAQARRNVGRAGHPDGWSLTVWPVLIGALGLGLLLITALSRRQRNARTSYRLIRSPEAGSRGEQVAGMGQFPSLGMPPEANGDPAGGGGTYRRADQADEAAASPNGAAANGAPVVGYASVCGPGGTDSRELKKQAEVIARECERRGLVLLEVVGERVPANGKGLGRPALSYALEQISAGQARGLVVCELSRLTRSAADLGRIIESLARFNARLVAAADALDTEDEDGRLAAALLVEVSRWERERLSERTRNGLQAARRSGRYTGRPAVNDNPDLRDRIAQMRAAGMTLQAIADQLNEDGVPTVRGGTKWRHSSVQVAAGYRRNQRPTPDPEADQRHAAQKE